MVTMSISDGSSLAIFGGAIVEEPLSVAACHSSKRVRLDEGCLLFGILSAGMWLLHCLNT